jgi:Uma2 family endonuclease
MSTTSLITFAELEQLPSLEGYKRELVNGEVVTMPPSELTPSDVAKRILLICSVTSTRRMCGRTIRAIALEAAGWSLTSASRGNQRRDGKYFAGSPMIAVEVLSPGEDIDEKLTLYFADGAKEVWVVNPRKKTMSAYVRQDGDVLRHQVVSEFRSQAARITITLQEIFG